MSREVDTPHGPARVHVHEPDGDASLVLALGHGAGGGVGAPDLVAVTRACVAAGVRVVLVEQPYHVAGKKGTPRPPVLDAAWEAVCAALPRDGLPLACGGRSSGARVACRTAQAVGAAAVVCLAFPLIPPRGEAFTRLPELEAPPVPVLVVQGANDRFGMPAQAPGRDVLQVDGDHSLRKGTAQIGAAVADWLDRNIGV